MRYYLDCEFNGYRGQLLDLALVREDDNSITLHWDWPDPIDPWVFEHVIPHRMRGAGNQVWGTPIFLAYVLQDFLKGDDDITIVSDWPDDIRYFCEVLVTGPGVMIDTPPGIKFEVRRVDAYPTTLVGAIQHNAWWDAMALKHLLEGAQ